MCRLWLQLAGLLGVFDRKRGRERQRGAERDREGRRDTDDRDSDRQMLRLGGQD